jgi:hypothetical protein
MLASRVPCTAAVAPAGSPRQRGATVSLVCLLGSSYRSSFVDCGALLPAREAAPARHEAAAVALRRSSFVGSVRTFACDATCIRTDVPAGQWQPMRSRVDTMADRASCYCRRPNAAGFLSKSTKRVGGPSQRPCGAGATIGRPSSAPQSGDSDGGTTMPSELRWQSSGTKLPRVNRSQASGAVRRDRGVNTRLGLPMVAPAPQGQTKATLNELRTSERSHVRFEVAQGEE